MSDDEIDLQELQRYVTDYPRKDRSGRLGHRSANKLQELDDAREALQGLGIVDPKIKLNEDDPPDVIAVIEDQTWGIEVTELIDQATQNERINGPWQIWREWTSEDAIAEVRSIVKRKDAKAFKGGPYDRKVLVIRTSELHLDFQRCVEIFKCVTFSSNQFTDICLTFGYHPLSEEQVIDRYPALRLATSKLVDGM